MQTKTDIPYLRTIFLYVSIIAILAISSCIGGAPTTSRPSEAGGAEGIITFAKSYGEEVSAERAYAVDQTDDDGDGQKDDGYIIAGGAARPIRRSTGRAAVDSSGRPVPGGGFEYELVKDFKLDGPLRITPDEDLWVQKMDSLGDVVWSKTYGHQNLILAQANSIEGTTDGGSIVAGTVRLADDSTDVGVTKLDREGRVLWTRIYNGRTDTATPSDQVNDAAYSIQQTRDGGYIVAGFTEARDRDMLVIKLDTKGDVTWQQHYGNSQRYAYADETAYSIRQTRDGGYIVAGTAVESGPTRNKSHIILKLRDDGTVQWSFPSRSAISDTPDVGFVYEFYSDNGAYSGAHSAMELLDGRFAIAGSTGSFQSAAVFEVDAIGRGIKVHEYGPGPVAIAGRGGGLFVATVESISRINQRDFTVEWTASNEPRATGGLMEVATDGSVYLVRKLFGGVQVLKFEPSRGGLLDTMTLDDFHNPVAVHTAADGGLVIASNIGDGVARLSRLSVDDTMLWDRLSTANYVETGNDRANSVQQTSDGGYIVAGYTVSSGAGQDMWVLKLNKDGSVAWQKTYGGLADAAGRAIQQTSDGGYIVAGRVRGPTLAVAWVLKLSGKGDVVWHRIYGGDERVNVANAIQQTSDGGYIVAGQAGSYFWLQKLTADGTVAWSNTYGESGEATSVLQTSDGGYIAAGYTGTSIEKDMWVFKLNKDGAVEWQRSFGGQEEDVANSVHQTADGGYVVAGLTRSFGGGQVCEGLPCPNFYVLKLDAEGTHLSAESQTFSWTFSTATYDAAYAVRQTADGGYIVVGETDGMNLSPDAWVLKLDSRGGISGCPAGMGPDITGRNPAITRESDTNAATRLGTTQSRDILDAQALVFQASAVVPQDKAVTVARSCAGFTPPIQATTTPPAPTPSTIQAPAPGGGASRGIVEPTLTLKVVGPGQIVARDTTNPWGNYLVAYENSTETKKKFTTEYYGPGLRNLGREWVLIANPLHRDLVLEGGRLVTKREPVDHFARAFAGWSGDADCSDARITLDRDVTCIATFTQGPAGQYPPAVKFEARTQFRTDLRAGVPVQVPDIRAGAPIQFRGIPSDHRDAGGRTSSGKMTSYEWDFQDDGAIDIRGDDATARDVTFTYQKPGTYVVRVRVADKDGVQAEYAEFIEVK